VNDELEGSPVQERPVAVMGWLPGVHIRPEQGKSLWNSDAKGYF